MVEMRERAHADDIKKQRQRIKCEKDQKSKIGCSRRKVQNRFHLDDDVLPVKKAVEVRRVENFDGQYGFLESKQHVSVAR